MHHFATDIFKCIFMNEDVSILIKISLRYVPKGPINNIRYIHPPHHGHTSQYKTASFQKEAMHTQVPL